MCAGKLSVSEIGKGRGAHHEKSHSYQFAIVSLIPLVDTYTALFTMAVRLFRSFQPLTIVQKRTFASTTIALAGRQGGRFRRPEKKYDVDHMEQFQFDDQTTMGHDLFENIRTVRQYLRKTEYELPKLKCEGYFLLLLTLYSPPFVYIYNLTNQP